MNSDQLYKIAADAVQRKKYAQAIEFFTQILEKDPEFVEARRGLRAVERNINGKPNKIAVKLSGLPILLKIRMLDMRKKYEEGILACEKYLRLDPNDTWVLYKEAQFAIELEYTKTASFCYENLAEINPDDANIVIEAADFLSDLGTEEGYNKANSMMTNLAKQNSDDVEITSEQSRIAAKKTLGKYEKAETSHDVLKDKAQAQVLEKEGQEIKSDEDLDAAIERARAREQADPSSARHKETVADLLLRKKAYKEAIDTYRQAIDLDPNNEATKTKMGEARMLLLTQQLERIKARLPQVTGAEKADLEEKYRAGAKKMQELKLTEYMRRLKVNPNDLKTRYELGVLFMKGGEVDKAIAQFQRSVTDARLGFSSARNLGLCFKAKKIFDMAIQQFQQAGQKSGAKAQDRLDVLYEIALCHEELEQPDKALAVFKQILEKDYSFKDTSQRVEELQKALKG